MAGTAPPVFATLGPEGTNHALVTRRYLAFHGIAEHARVVLLPDFPAAFAALACGEVDHIVMCAVHPDTTGLVAQHWREAPIVDTFIAPGMPLAVLTRREIVHPRSLGHQPATLRYVDAARWERHVPEPTIVAVAQGLLAGRYDSGIAALAFAERHGDVLRVDEVVGAPDDAWLVFGRERACTGGVLAWRDSPAAMRWRDRSDAPRAAAK